MSGLFVLAFASVSWTLPCSAQASQTPVLVPDRSSVERSEPNPQPMAAAAADEAPDQASDQNPKQRSDQRPDQRPDQPTTGSVNGTVVDQSGAVVAGARVRLTGEGPSPSQEVLSGGDGQFSFTNVAPGPFQLTITSAGFSPQTLSGNLLAGEIHTVAQIALAVALDVTDVQVSLSPAEIAKAQVKEEEKQRMLRIIPFFFATYDPHPVALTSKEKFELAWKTSVDPVTFVIVGGIAGVHQAQDAFSEYGEGAQGYAKRYGASFADGTIGTVIGSAILPSLLKQDPRYFYKGTGTKRSRVLYAIANAAICKGDNGRWQVNYSNVLGNLAAGGISNLYYPPQSRGAGLSFENGSLGIASTAAANLVEEFLMRKLAPKTAKHEPTAP